MKTSLDSKLQIYSICPIDTCSRNSAIVEKTAGAYFQQLCIEIDPKEKLIMRFINELEKLDPQDIFAMPVTDQIAPGYSTMIRNPMDFSTIKARVNTVES